MSFILTLFLRRTANVIGLIDVPNERSSHAVPTPRGGGLAIVIASLAGTALLAVLGGIGTHLCVALIVGGAMVATVGFIDDRNSLSAGKRLVVHFIAAIWAIAWIGPLTSLRIANSVVQLGPIGYLLSTLGIVWFLNIFNFMDGIDGIAGSETVFICAAVVLAAYFSGTLKEIPISASVIGFATAGFLLWNWPPAKIFLGDVGSGYLGFMIAALALAQARVDPSALWTWLIIGGVFVVDADITLIRRFLRGEHLALAHREHAFQWLARKFGHATVTISVILVNVLWLLPCAVASVIWPVYAFWIALLALSPLVIGAIAIGAGRPETACEPPSRARSHKAVPTFTRTYGTNALLPFQSFAQRRARNFSGRHKTPDATSRPQTRSAPTAHVTLQIIDGDVTRELDRSHTTHATKPALQNAQFSTTSIACQQNLPTTDNSSQGPENQDVDDHHSSDTRDSYYTIERTVAS